MAGTTDLASIQGSEKLSVPSHSILDNISHTSAEGSGSGTVLVPDARLLFGGDYKQSGLDLILSKDGRDFTIHDYFKGSHHADLTSPDGARLDGSLIDAMTAGHTQYAQASGAADAAKVIGQVTKLTGSATAIRNGVAVELHAGDNVMKGDVVQAGAGANCVMTFVDGTVFGLSSNARMVLNEMIYDPNGSSNTALMSLVQGTITFVAGETAKHGDMKVDTPVATMGIRGTAILCEIGFEVQFSNAPPVKFQLLLEKGNVAGSALLFSKSDPNTPIDTLDRTAVASFIDGLGNVTHGSSPPLSDVAKQIIKDAFSVYFPGYVPDLDNANPQSHPGSFGSPPWEQPGGGFYPIPQSLPFDQPFKFTIPINLPGTNIQDPALQVTFTPPSAPVITAKSISVSRGQSVVLSSKNINASDDNHDPIFTFHVSNVSHGVFQITTDGTHWFDTTSFTTTDITLGHVRFVADNSGLPPAFSIQADNGETFNNLSDVENGNVQFIDHIAPQLTAASFTVAQGDSIVLDAANFAIKDADSSTFTYSILNVTHGHFQLFDGTNWNDVNSFTSADLAAHHVRFLSDGSDIRPTFTLQVDDGQPVNNISNVINGAVTLTVGPIPLITDASFTVNDGHSTLLSTSNFGVTDHDPNAIFTFTILSVAHGHFQLFDGTNWNNVTTFTAADLGAGHIRFTPDGSDLPPTFTIQVDDGTPLNHQSNPFTGSITFVDPAPLVTAASFSVDQGGTVLLSTANFHVTDLDDSAFTFVVTQVSGGHFQFFDGYNWVNVDSFTTAELDAHLVRFQADGGDAKPTFTIEADNGDPVNHLSDPFVGSVNFTNDPAPVITAASFTVNDGQSTLLSTSNFGVIDHDPNANLTFTILSVAHGHFELFDGHHWTNVDSFTNAELAAHLVRFTADGSDLPPTFTVQVDDGTPVNQQSQPFTGSITFVDPAPVVTAASFSVGQGDAVLLSNANFHVTDPDDSSFTFFVSNVSGGRFQLFNGTAWIDADSFTTADLAAHHVRFQTDGGDAAPAFTIKADNGDSIDHLSDPFTGSVNFTNDPVPVITAASFTVNDGQSTLLSTSNFSVTDHDPNASFAFTIVSVAHGHFQLFDGTAWNNATTFTTADLVANHVRFTADGSDLQPTFTVQVDDGTAINHQSNPFVGSITFVDPAPVVTAASFSVGQGDTVLLSTSNFNVTDPDDSSFTFLVSGVSGGHFQLFNGTNWVNVDSFTTSDLSAHHVRFATDGGDAAPAYTIKADNGDPINHLSDPFVGSVNFTNDPAPVITAASFTVNDGQSTVLSTSNFSVTDNDPNASFAFSILSVAHGNFQLFDGTHWNNVTTFTTADLAAHHVRFTADGSDLQPTFTVQVDDGTAINHQSDPFTGSINFIDPAPTITAASFTVGQGDTVLLSNANFSVSDPDDTSFTFLVSGVSGGHFQLFNGTAWINADAFTTADLTAHHVRFQTDGGDAAPAFTIKADNGDPIDHLSGPFTGSVNFTNDPAPVVKAASFSVEEGGSTLLSTSNFSIADSDPNGTTFTFSVSNVTHGHFQLFDGTNWNNVTAFTTGDLTAGHVRFLDAGGDDTPTFTVQVDDGTAVNHQSNPFTGSVTLIDNDDSPTDITFALNSSASFSSVGKFSPVGDPEATKFTWSVGGGSSHGFAIGSDGTLDVTNIARGTDDVLNATVTDQDGNSFTKTFHVWVSAANEDEGQTFNFAAHGDNGSNIAIGSSQNDTFVGSGSSDYFVGGAGNDTLIGGGGADQLIGGSGQDTFKFVATTDSTPTTHDTIFDFTGGNAGNHDYLAFANSLGLTSYDAQISGTTLAAGHVGWKEVGGETVVYANASASTEIIGTNISMEIHLKGTGLGLTINDFLLHA